MRFTSLHLVDHYPWTGLLCPSQKGQICPAVARRTRWTVRIVSVHIEATMSRCRCVGISPLISHRIFCLNIPQEYSTPTRATSGANLDDSCRMCLRLSKCCNTGLSFLESGRLPRAVSMSASGASVGAVDILSRNHPRSQSTCFFSPWPFHRTPPGVYPSPPRFLQKLPR